MKKIYTILYYQSVRNELWYWKLLSKNGRIIADGAEGYNSKSSVIRAIKRNKAFNFDVILLREEKSYASN
jgi:uncharacterized protein YegP (UPF0339 family)